MLTICDAIDPFLKVGPTNPAGQREMEDDGDESEEEKYGRKSRVKIGGINSARNDHEDDLDL